jgi:hypothetical protein
MACLDKTILIEVILRRFRCPLSLAEYPLKIPHGYLAMRWSPLPSGRRIFTRSYLDTARLYGVN